MGDDVAEKTEDPRPTRRWLGPLLEGILAFGAMALMLWWSTGIWAVPIERPAQVSGLASLQLRLFAIAVPAIAAMVIAVRVRGGAHFAMTARLACAVLAGLATGFVAGGLVIALKGTPWCLNGQYGDSEQLVVWANAINAKFSPEYPPALYPPMFPHVLAWWSDISDQPASYALKDLQILFTAIAGPLAYLAWRLLLRPGWALGIGVVAALVVLEPYKPYGSIVLVTFLPIIIRFIQILRRAHERHWFQLVKLGVVFGVAFGLSCLLYSGWFRWSTPGILLAALLVFPWKRGWKNALIFGAAASVIFAVFTFGYFTEIRSVASRNPAGTPLLKDDYVFFDVNVDPAYVAMWKGDLPGTTTTWPPPGELAGVGVFTALVIAGLGVAVMFGYRRTVVIVLGLVLLGVWIQRHWTAHYLFTTKQVALYPRTTYEIVYILVVLSGFAIYYMTESIARRIPTTPLRTPPAMIGAFCALVLLLGSMASSLADKYMPLDSFPRSTGWLAWQAHLAKKDRISPYWKPGSPQPPPLSAPP